MNVNIVSPFCCCYSAIFFFSLSFLSSFPLSQRLHNLPCNLFYFCIFLLNPFKVFPPEGKNHFTEALLYIILFLECYIIIHLVFLVNDGILIIVTDCHFLGYIWYYCYCCLNYFTQGNITVVGSCFSWYTETDNAQVS